MSVTIVPHAANTPSSGSTNPVVDQHEPGHSLLSQHAQRSTRPRGRQFFRHEQHLRKPQRNIPPPIPRGSRFATGQNCEIAEPPPVLPPGKREAPSLSPAPTGSATRCRSRTPPGAHPNGPEFPTRPNCCSDRSRPPSYESSPFEHRSDEPAGCIAGDPPPHGPRPGPTTASEIR